MDLLILLIVSAVVFSAFVYAMDRDYKKGKAKEEARDNERKIILDEEKLKEKYLIKIESATVGTVYSRTIDPYFLFGELVSSKRAAESVLRYSYESGKLALEDGSYVPTCSVFRTKVIKESEKEL